MRGAYSRFIPITSEADAWLSSMGTVTASIIQQGESHKKAFVSAAMTPHWETKDKPNKGFIFIEILHFEGFFNQLSYSSQVL